MSRQRATKTADEYRAEATGHNRTAAESFERCDTDGFLSQWASGVNEQRANALARLAENGGRAYFEVYLDEKGDPVPARSIRTKYGNRIAVFGSWADCCRRGGEIIEWLSSKKADARWESGYFEAEGAIEMAGDLTPMPFILPFRGYDLGLGARYSPGDATVVADPRPEVAR